MDLDQVHTYIMTKVGASEERPFDLETPVYKVMGKMFALLAPERTPQCLTLKCDPDHALLLREIYDTVKPGYHMNKKHWNTIALDGSVPDDEIEEMIDESYDLVVRGLTKAAQRELAGFSESS